MKELIKYCKGTTKASRAARVLLCVTLAVLFAFGYDALLGFYYDGVDTGLLYNIYLGTDGSAGSATLIVSNVVLGWILVLGTRVAPDIHGLSLYLLLLYFSSMAVIIHTWLFRLSWTNVLTKDWLTRNLFPRALLLFLLLATHAMLCFTMLAGLALFIGCFLVLINTHKYAYRHLLIGGWLMLGGVFLRTQFAPIFFFFLFCFLAYSFWQNRSWRPQKMAWSAIILITTMLVSLVAHNLYGNKDVRAPDALKTYTLLTSLFDYPKDKSKLHNDVAEVFTTEERKVFLDKNFADITTFSYKGMKCFQEECLPPLTPIQKMLTAPGQMFIIFLEPVIAMVLITVSMLLCRQRKAIILAYILCAFSLFLMTYLGYQGRIQIRAWWPILFFFVLYATYALDKTNLCISPARRRIIVWLSGLFILIVSGRFIVTKSPVSAHFRYLHLNLSKHDFKTTENKAMTQMFALAREHRDCVFFRPLVWPSMALTWAVPPPDVLRLYWDKKVPVNVCKMGDWDMYSETYQNQLEALRIKSPYHALLSDNFYVVYALENKDETQVINIYNYVKSKFDPNCQLRCIRLQHPYSEIVLFKIEQSGATKTPKNSIEILTETTPATIHEAHDTANNAQ